MAIGNDDVNLYDDLDDLGSEELVENSSQTDSTDETTQDANIDKNEGNINRDDFINFLLKSKGIEDITKIKFEDEDGTVIEQDWNKLSNEEKLNILNSSSETPDTDLDDSEIQLINTIRQSGLTPAEYINNIQQQGIDNYIQNSQKAEHQYQIDQYSDDELFIFDLMSRMQDITDEEAQGALENAKSNETLYTKQIAALRNEYKLIEDENLRQAQFEQEEQEREQYNQFANQIADQIGNFDEFSGYDLNLSNDDRDELYEFITGVDGAGNNYFAKALSDPQILVQTAWFALNGKQMLEDITSYFTNEIKQVRKESYKKGLEDGKSGNNVVFKSTETVDSAFDDLDNF